jgi:circadian clock protein KaiC
VTDHPRVVITKLATGVPGLDEVLGGGIPEFSFNLIAGAPGVGKTTIVQQIMFANATRERPALFFTVLGEPPVKMLRYQQQFAFFDPARVGEDIHFINLSEEVLHRNLDSVLERISREVEGRSPSVVVVDSFRTVVRTAEEPGLSELDLQYFLQRLALRLTSWETTSFLIGEFAEGESRNPVFTIADGVIWLLNEVERNSTVRKLRVTKIRGQPAMSGMHSLRINSDGIEVFPRIPEKEPVRPRKKVEDRQSIGVKALDEMMGGGVPVGDSVMLTGPTGSGKSILATQFVTAGFEKGECAVIAVFEEHPEQYIQRAVLLGFPLDRMIAEGRLDVLYLRPIDLSVDETLQTIRDRVLKLGATRLVIDSMSGFEVALAPTFRLDFRESYYRLLRALTTLGITVISTIEVVESSDYLRFAPYNVSFLSDVIIAMRYIELKGELKRVIAVIKMRSSAHSSELRLFEVTSHGLQIGDSLEGYRGIVTGIPEKIRD